MTTAVAVTSPGAGVLGGRDDAYVGAGAVAAGGSTDAFRESRLDSNTPPKAVPAMTVIATGARMARIRLRLRGGAAAGAAGCA
jgi:hypothetical protein